MTILIFLIVPISRRGLSHSYVIYIHMHAIS